MVSKFVYLLLRFFKIKHPHMPEPLLTINSAIVATFDRTYQEYQVNDVDPKTGEKIIVHVGERYRIAWKDDRDRPYGFQKNAVYTIQEILVAEEGSIIYFKFQQFPVLHDSSKLQISVLPL